MAAITLATSFVAADAAQAATVNPGSLKLLTKKADAGTQGVGLGWTYRAQKPTAPATITITVPAGFSAPQTGTPSAPGYLSATSPCAQFQVAGTAAQPDGSNVITVATDCADGQVATLSYGNVTVPTTPGTFAFPATFTPAGAAAIPFADANTFTVDAAPLASLTISPANSTIAPGATQAYTAQGSDAFGNPVALDPAGTRYSISPNGSCTGATCTATTPGAHTVTVKNKGIATTATLTVSVAPAGADLAVAQAVSGNAPFYYGTVSFTTTVTNTSASTTAQGVTATVAIPAGLVSPTASPSVGTFSLSTGVWTIGDLAPGAHATLTVSALAGDIALGAQTVTATVSSATADPASANNTASATATSQPAPVAIVITPDPNNPPPNNVDISAPGTMTFTASFANAANPAAPAPTGTVVWTCDTQGGSPCPSAAALNPSANLPVLTFVTNGLVIDQYFLTATFFPAGDGGNYVQEGVQSSISFTTTNSGS
ncbi:DUF11 domain-containing protein [Pseudofrankia saprophytica]|uniref:DUF11 domain-containing protein n=1 Tax=Pseudofrankia saprophytica TaxID=298655 RepID=UPI0002FD9A32|nr:DUF11 domain-containing protein [Pseudofrankia saprophytica]